MDIKRLAIQTGDFGTRYDIDGAQECFSFTYSELLRFAEAYHQARLHEATPSYKKLSDEK